MGRDRRREGEDARGGECPGPRVGGGVGNRLNERLFQRGEKDSVKMQGGKKVFREGFRHGEGRE